MLYTWNWCYMLNIFYKATHSTSLGLMLSMYLSKKQLISHFKNQRPAFYPGMCSYIETVNAHACSHVKCCLVFFSLKVEEAEQVYLLMKEEYRISRNVRLSWFLNRLNQVVRPSPLSELVRDRLVWFHNRLIGFIMTRCEYLEKRVISFW